MATIEYDLFNRMVKYEKGTDVYTYTYNGDGQRMSKTVHGFTTKFVWDGKNMVYEYIDAMNNTWYYYGNGVEVQLSADNLKEMEVYNKNAYGDIVSVNGWQTLYVVGMEFSYDAYGNEIEEYYNADGYAGCSFRYRGEYYDGETGFYYLRNRYYDPKKGRFITEDPIRDGTNWYTYCAGNPIVFVDPSGNWVVLALEYVQGQLVAGFGGGKGIAFDQNFTIADIDTFSAIVGSPGIGTGVQLMFFKDAESVKDIAGAGFDCSLDINASIGPVGIVGSFSENGPTGIGGTYDALGDGKTLTISITRTDVTINENANITDVCLWLNGILNDEAKAFLNKNVFQDYVLIPGSKATTMHEYLKDFVSSRYLLQSYKDGGYIE